MGVNNSLQKQRNSKPPFSVAIKQDAWQKLINDTLGDKEIVRRFVADISATVAVNPALQECDAGTVLSAALLGETLKLSPSPQLGQYYMVPYKQKEKRDRDGNILTPERTVAQFQLGYKGYIQLAIRSGQYRSLNVVPVLQGELAIVSPLFEQYEYHPITDYETRKNTPVVGYVSAFELVNGYRKVLYWSKEEMLAHADRYSQAFSKDATTGRYPKVSFADYEARNYPPGDEWKYSSFWYKDFDGMACKTMLRQLISKWGIMSIDLQKALASDEAALNTDGTTNYIDTTSDDTEPTKPPQADPATGEVTEELPDGFFPSGDDGQVQIA